MAKQLKAVTSKLNKIKLVKKTTPKKNKQKKARSTRRAHPRNAGILTTEHSQPVYGLMDAVPTAAVVSRGQSAVAMAANEYCLFMGIGDHQRSLSSYVDGSPDPDVTRYLKPIQSIGYRFTASGGNQGWRPTEINNTAVTTSPQYAMNPYNADSTYKSKVNKMTLHLSFMGTQALMSAEFRIYIDYHGDLMGQLPNVNGPKLIDTFNKVFNHPRVIKVKVESGHTIDYSIPFPCAQLIEGQTVDPSFFVPNALNGEVTIMKANGEALTDSRSGSGSQAWFYRKESTNATVDYENQGISSTPLVYVACIFQTSAQVSCTCTMDCEYHDEELYSVSSPSICDPSTAGSIHALVMNAHHEATTKPLHPSGLRFKDVIRKAVKAEHVAQSVAASPLGQAVVAAALA